MAENMDQLYQQMFTLNDNGRRSIIDQAMMGNGYNNNQQNGIRNRNTDNDKQDNNK